VFFLKTFALLGLYVGVRGRSGSIGEYATVRRSGHGTDPAAAG
jgi:hypothetical protein